MAIKQYFETALRGIEQERERAISVAREKAMREKIVPNNATIDASRTEAINALTANLNKEISALQEKFNIEKQAIIEASEKKKSEFATATMETEASIVSVQYDAAINALKKQISEIKE
jgi:hypothetical protein